MNRVKRIEWNNVSLVVDVAIMSVAISRDSSRVVCSSSSKLARFARSPAGLQPRHHRCDNFNLARVGPLLPCPSGVFLPHFLLERSSEEVRVQEDYVVLWVDGLRLCKF